VVGLCVSANRERGTVSLRFILNIAYSLCPSCTAIDYDQVLVVEMTSHCILNGVALPAMFVRDSRRGPRLYIPSRLKFCLSSTFRRLFECLCLAKSFLIGRHAFIDVRRN